MKISPDSIPIANIRLPLECQHRVQTNEMIENLHLAVGSVGGERNGRGSGTCWYCRDCRPFLTIFARPPPDFDLQ